MNVGNPTYDRLVDLVRHSGDVTVYDVADAMDLSVTQAEDLLDELAIHDVLELTIDDNGQVIYRIGPDHEPLGSPPRPNGGRHRGSFERQAPTGADGGLGHRTRQGPGAQLPPKRSHQPAGADGAVGSPRRPGPPRPRPQADGCDGSIGYPSDGADIWGWDGQAQDRPLDANNTPTVETGPDGADGHRLPAKHRPHRPPRLRQDEENALARRRVPSPLLAGLLSTFFLGLGQIYNGRWGKAAFLWGASLLLWYFWAGWLVYIWGVFDAYFDAKHTREMLLEDKPLC